MSDENKQNLKKYQKSYCKIIFFSFYVQYKIRENLTFGDIEIKKSESKKCKYPVEKGFKYSIDYNDGEKVRSLCIMLP